jgi:carbonic anhydrase
MTPDEALVLMKEGNAGYLSDAPLRPHLTGSARRAALAEAQKPFCVLVGCSDSRVSPELLFGRGLGDLFIVRNAGNVVDLAAMGSIEYGVAVLGAPLVVVLGHERCGAVQAAVNVVEHDATYPGSIGQMIEPILPAVLRARREGTDDLLDRAVKANVQRIVERLRTTEQMLQEPQREGLLKIVGAHYDLDTGHVEFFE